MTAEHYRSMSEKTRFDLRMAYAMRDNWAAEQELSAYEKWLDRPIRVVKGRVFLYHFPILENPKWILDFPESIFQKSQIDFRKIPNRFAENPKPIPDINTYITQI